MNWDEAIAMVGQQVEWESPSLKRIDGERTRRRMGVLVALIPAGVSPCAVYPDLRHIRSSQSKLGSGVDGTSVNDRALIRVDRMGRNGKRLPPWYYGPRLSAVWGGGVGSANKATGLVPKWPGSIGG